MSDRISKSQRSKNMTAVRSRGNLTTELALAKIFRKEGITGWRRHLMVFGVRPDFIFMDKKTVVFVHGCFWHGCKKHRSIPITRRPFWKEKILKNRLRDLRNVVSLRRRGWKSVVVWEHEIKSKPEVVGSRIKSVLKTLLL